ncbi:MAG: ATP-dependent DNA helicase [candidate division Zixibacteria bacterium]
MQLSDMQKLAVEYLDTPQIILAGAGSGKTRVIVAKAKYLIEEKGYSPDSILVITYSRKTQAELEERMADLGTSAPELTTFHSLGLDIINEFSHLLGFSGEAVKADEYRLYKYLLNAIAELTDSKLLRTNNPGSVYYALKSFISRAKDELVIPSELISRAQKELHDLPRDSAIDDDEKLIARDRWTRIYEASRIYQSYERLKSSDSDGGTTWIDYNDMIVLSHMLLSTEKIVGAILRQRIKYILVDEFQDANFAQVEMLHYLAGDKVGITVVGDDDQAIYRFRGASFGSFKLFKNLFANVKDHKLEENYRSTQNIVNAAQSLIEIEPDSRFDPDKRMFASGLEGDKVKIRICPDHETESESTADEIIALLKNELYRRPKSIAVLFRARTHKDLLENVLIKRGIDFSYDKKTDKSSSPASKLLLALYEFTVDYGRSDHMAYLIDHFMVDLGPHDKREIMYKISRSESDPLDILHAAAEESGESVSSHLKKLIDLLLYFGKMKSEKDPLGLLEIIVSKAGILSLLISDGKIKDYQAVVEVTGILRSAETFIHGNTSPSHSDFLAYRNWNEGSAGNDTNDEDIQPPVVLRTVHGSKGLEYPVVFVIGLSNRRFPPTRKSSSVEFPQELYKDELPEGDYRIQEERRLFYVAMTRAREKLYLYGMEKKGTKRSRFLQELASAPFFMDAAESELIKQRELLVISEIGPAQTGESCNSVIIPGSGAVDKSISDGLFDLWRVRSFSAESPEEFAKIKEEFQAQLLLAQLSLKDAIDQDEYSPPRPAKRYKVDRISYTDLETFDSCPLKFYYKKILRMPSPPSPHQILGQVIHTVLENAARAMMDGDTPGLVSLVSDFEGRWKKIRLSDPDQKERMGQRGAELLGEYMTMQAKLDGFPAALEKFFEIKLSSAKLIGRIDRIDKTESGLRVIDYKTGKKGKNKLDKNLQLPIYSLACKELFGEYPSELMFMFLGDGTDHTTSSDPGSLDAAKVEIEEKVAAINESDFIATPGGSCRLCEFARICPAKAG